MTVERDVRAGVGMRELGAADDFLLRTATWLNLNWPGERLTFAQMDADDRLSRYCRLVPGNGDFGFASVLAGQPTGVVWVKYFSGGEPGYGFVRPGVPELSVCVLPGYRGAGLGGALVRAALAEARRRGVAEVSLSVEEGNPARRLYERLGFVPVASAAHAGTLSLVLDAGRRPPRR